MHKIINGKEIAETLLGSAKTETSKLQIKPKLVIITYNADERSRVYIDLKLKKAKGVGIDCDLIDWSGKTLIDCKSEMHKLASNDSVDAIIVQLPMIDLENSQEVLDLIPTNKDVDGLSSTSIEALKNNNYLLTPATPKAILEIIEQEDIGLNGKNILVIGKGKLVGLPLSIILKNKGYEVITVDKNTKNLSDITKKADVIISAAGAPKLLTGDIVKNGVIILDAGAAEADGKIVGDVDYESVEPKTSIISKVPGGIGPVTVACLFENVIQTTKNSR